MVQAREFEMGSRVGRLGDGGLVSPIDDAVVVYLLLP